MATFTQIVVNLCLFYLSTVTNALAIKNDQLNADQLSADQLSADQLNAVPSLIDDNRMTVYMQMDKGQFIIILGLMLMGGTGFVGLISYFTYKVASRADLNK